MSQPGLPWRCRPPLSHCSDIVPALCNVATSSLRKLPKKRRHERGSNAPVPLLSRACDQWYRSDRRNESMTSRKSSSGPVAALELEFAQERASALGRLGRALEDALTALAHVDPAGAERKRLVEEASLALWHFVVQREACGLRDLSAVLRNYRVPREVAVRMGVMPASRR